VAACRCDSVPRMNPRALVAEFVGTAGLLLAIVGSGITAGADGAASSQLFQHAAVVGAALYALILTFGSVSGAHFNPAVTVVDVWFGGMSARTGLAYAGVQVAGAIVGTVGANLLFGLPAVAASTTDRTGFGAAASEVVATFGLLLVIFGVVRSGRAASVPAAVGAWIAGAIYFTSSASFANPAVTVARMVTDTGVAAVPGFLVAQAVGVALAALTIRWLFVDVAGIAPDVIVPHDATRGDSS
jgi:arsenate reductase